MEAICAGGVPACPESSSEARKQQSRSSAFMVTAKRAQLLLASIYMVGASRHGRQRRAGEKGHTVTRATANMMGKKPRPPKATVGIFLGSKHQKQSPVVISPNMPGII